MNKARRKQIEALIAHVETTVEPLLDEVAYAEEDAYRALPESLADSDKGKAIRKAADHLDHAQDDLGAMLSALRSSIRK